MPTREELDKGFRIGAWEIYPARGELLSGEQVEKPEPKVMAVLLSLAMRNGDVVTKDEIVDEVWGGQATADDPIIRCIFQLRGHFNDRVKPSRLVGSGRDCRRAGHSRDCLKVLHAIRRWRNRILAAGRLRMARSGGRLSLVVCHAGTSSF